MNKCETAPDVYRARREHNNANIERFFNEAARRLGEQIINDLIRMLIEREMYQMHGNGD